MLRKDVIMKIVTYYKTSLRYFLKLFKDLNGQWIQGGDYKYAKYLL